MSRGLRLFRRSTVFVSVGNSIKVYRSIDDVPDEVREKLRDTPGEWDSATIIIADERGKEEVIRALQRQRSALNLQVLGGCDGTESTYAWRVVNWVYRRRKWLALSAAPAAALLIWFVLSRLI